MPTVRKVTPPAAPSPLTDPALDDALIQLRAAGYEVKRQGMHWQVRINGSDATMLKTAEVRDLASSLPPTAPALPNVQPADANAAILVDLAEIVDNPFQPRLDYDEERVAAIAKSIRESGLLQIPLARKVAHDRYELAFGHTRLRAFVQLAERDATRFGRMPLIVRELGDETMALHAWTENKDRKDLTAYEEAKAIERYTTVFGWTQAQAAAKLHLDRSTVANKVRLLKLPAAAIAQLRSGALSERQALALLPLAELPATAQSPSQIWLGNSTIGYVKSADDLVAKAASVDSATLREAVSNFVGQMSIPLKDKPWRNLDADGVRSASCKDCPFRIAAADRCTDKACANIKERAWSRQQAAAAAAAAGLPTTACNGYNDHDDLSGVNLKAIKAKAQEKGCGNLAVLFDGRGYHPHEIEGFTGCGIVCGHGANKRCACKMALARSADPRVSQEAKERAERAKIKAELIGPAQQAAARALATATPAVWRTLLDQIDSRAKVAKDADLATIQAAIAAKLVDLATQYSLGYSPSYAGARKELAKLLGDLGAIPPWAGDETSATAARKRIAEALELAGHPMAPAFLKEARDFAGQVGDPAARAALLGEIKVAADVCAQTTTEQPADLVAAFEASDATEAAAEAQLLNLNRRLVEIEVWIAQAITTPPKLDAISGFEETLDAIDDDLADLVGDEATVTDEAFEGLLLRIGQARRQLAALFKPRPAPQLAEVGA